MGGDQQIPVPSANPLPLGCAGHWRKVHGQEIFGFAEGPRSLVNHNFSPQKTSMQAYRPVASSGLLPGT